MNDKKPTEWIKQSPGTWGAHHTHTWVTCLHTSTFSSLMSSKCKTLEVVLSVFTQVWVSAFRCTHTFACPFTTHTNTHALTHHLLSGPYPWWRTLSLCLFEGRGGSSNGLERACFLVGVKLWPGLKVATIQSPPPPPREAIVWDPFWTSTCWENFTLDTLFRPFCR